MKLKNVVCGIVGVVATIGAADALTTAEIKAACQASDKTLWVERNQVCIPRNPCEDSKFEQYCNRAFRDVQTHGNLYKGLIELYAYTHNLSCMPVEQESKLFGQDYVVCMGTDVMVFEFDDIHETGSFWKMQRDFYKDLANGLCSAVDGYLDDDVCDGINQNTCEKISQTIKKYDTEFVVDNKQYVSGTAWGWGDYKKDKCIIKKDFKITGGDVHNLYEYDPSYESGHFTEQGYYDWE